MRVSARLLNVVLAALLFVSLLVIFSDLFGKKEIAVPAPVPDPTPPPPTGDFLSDRISLKRNFVSNHPIARPPRRMIEFYKLQVPQRRAYLDAVIESMSKNYMYLYNNLAPEAYCPELVRVGTTNDGGKWICSPFRIPSACNILSLGMYNEITFEEELQHITDKRCNLFAYDMNRQEPQTMIRLKKINVGVRVAEISAETNEMKKRYTVESLMKLEGITTFEILKIDIEGSEFQVIPPLLRKHKPAQVLIEIHGTPSETVWLLRDIASQGYWLYSYEINGAWHHLCEYSFIHESAFNQYGVTPMAKYLN